MTLNSAPATRRPDPVIYVLEPFGGSARRHNPALPHLYFDDSAVTRGDGVFETLLVRGGKAVKAGRHLDRFTASARAMGLPDVDTRQWERATAEAAAEWAAANDDAEARCTWTYSHGRASSGLPTAWVIVQGLSPETLELRERGVKVVTTTRGYTLSDTPEWFPGGAKTLSYANTAAALRWAREQGAEDVLFLDSPEGKVLEGATSSVIVVKPGRKLRTPPSGAGVLAGTTQAAIFDLAEARGWRCSARELTYEDLFEAESVWLVSSTRMAVRVRKLDGRKLPGGPLDDEVRELVDAALS